MDKVTSFHSAAACRLPLTEVALCAWVGTAAPGDSLVYHQGYLAIDAGAGGAWRTPAQRHELRRVASRAWQLAQEGRVHLMQRWCADAVYSYILVVRPRPREAGGALQIVVDQAGISGLRRSA